MFAKTLATFLSASIIASPAMAGEPLGDDVDFAFKAHELETSGGVSDLYARLTFRAERACSTPGIKPVYQRQFEEECTARLTDEFVAKIDDPRLTRVHAAEQGAVFIAQE